MSTRNFDLFGLKFGASPDLATPTQIVGPLTMSISAGYRRTIASNDGLMGPAAVDKGPWYARGSVACQDATGLTGMLAAWEAAAGGLRAIQAQGLEQGAATATATLVKRAVLVGATLRLKNGEYADVSYNWAVSADGASVAPQDEISMTAAQTKVATIGAGKRVYKLSASHAAVPINVATDFELQIRGQEVAAPPADGEWGEVVSVGGYRVTGSVTIADVSIAASQSVAQTVCEAARGNTVITILEQGGALEDNLTIANCRFFESDDQARARQYRGVRVDFEAEFLSGTTVYALASGGTKVLSMGAAG